MVDMKEIEKLAEAIYDEVVRVFNQRTGGNPETHCPFAEQGETIRMAYICGARTANTLIINAMVRQDLEDKL